MMGATRIIVETKQAAESTEQSIRDWAIAAGTLGAIVVALYIGVWRERRHRPKLSLAYHGPEGGDAVVVRKVRDGPLAVDVAYVRLRVVAKKRRAAADDAEVMVLRVTELAPREGYQPQTDNVTIEGQLLGWSNVVPTTTRLTIPPGVHRHLDLVRVDKSAPDIAAAQITVAAVPVDRRNAVKSGSFEIELAVTARNMDARRYRVVIDYDGGWGKDVWEHLRVQEPRPIR
jgi:hypothetical protein